MSVFAQSSFDLDWFDSDDDFIDFLVWVLDEDTDIEEDVDIYATTDYISTSTARSVTIETKNTFSYTDQEDSYTIYMYTDEWSKLAWVSSSRRDPFLVRTFITPTYDTDGHARMYIWGLLPNQTYTFVITPGKNLWAQEWVEMSIKTKSDSQKQSKAFEFLVDTLFDWSAFSSYIDEGENSAMFLGMLMDKLYDMSTSRQETVIRGMGKNLKAMKQFGFTSLGLDYDWFVALLEDAWNEAKGSSSSSVSTNTKNLDIDWQVFPSKQAWKKWVVFRTNFSELGIHRATWHMPYGKIHGCDRAMCDRFWYELDSWETHNIHVNMSQFKVNRYEGFNEKLTIKL